MNTFVICFAAIFAVAFDQSSMASTTSTTIDQHPHQISLSNGSSQHCGGSIISPVRALSAAHCLHPLSSPSIYTILAGSTTRIGESSGRIRILSRFVIHARHDTPVFANDIAILSWEEPLTFGANIRPIRIPTANATVPYGQNATTSGWGVTIPGFPSSSEILKAVTLSLVSNDDCNRAYRGKVTPDMVCAGGEADQSVCSGDSGGPLVHNNTLIGITSWTRSPCGAKGFPNVFARVAFFIDWIDENMN